VVGWSATMKVGGTSVSAVRVPFGAIGTGDHPVARQLEAAATRALRHYRWIRRLPEALDQNPE
jgi:hypothetical protein